MTITSEERFHHIDYLRENVDGLNNHKIRSLIADYQAKLIERKQTSEIRATSSFLSGILENLGRTGHIEARDCFYSGLALTHVPEHLKPLFKSEHYLIKDAIVAAGKMNYDPMESPFNPEEALADNSEEVCDIDTLMIIASRGFSFTDLAASTGGGMEIRTANIYGKIPLNFMKMQEGFRMSRMVCGARRVIHVGYKDMAKQKDMVGDLIARITEFDQGIGYCAEHENTLVGLDQNGRHTCLIGWMQEQFPELKFDFSQYLK
jgi:hypothetical protein